MTDYRPGSMGAAEKKSSLIFEIGFTLINFLVFLMLFAGWPHTDLVYYVKASGWAWHVIAILLLLASTAILWYGIYKEWKYGHWALFLVLTGLSILVACGFQFSDMALPGHSVIPN